MRCLSVTRWFCVVLVLISFSAFAAEKEPDRKKVERERLINLSLIKEFERVPLRPFFKNKLLSTIDNSSDLKYFKDKINRWNGWGKYSLSIAGPEILVSIENIPAFHVTEISKYKMRIDGVEISRKKGTSARVALKNHFQILKNKKSAAFDLHGFLKLLLPLADADIDEDKAVLDYHPLALLWYSGGAWFDLMDESKEPPNVAELADIFANLQDPDNPADAYLPAHQISCVRNPETDKFSVVTGTFNVATTFEGDKTIPITFSVEDEGTKVSFKVGSTQAVPISMETGMSFRSVIMPSLDRQFMIDDNSWTDRGLTNAERLEKLTAPNRHVGSFDRILGHIKQILRDNQPNPKNPKYAASSLDVGMNTQKVVEMRKAICSKVESVVVVNVKSSCFAARYNISRIDFNSKVSFRQQEVNELERQISLLDQTLKEVEGYYMLKKRRSWLGSIWSNFPEDRAKELEDNTDFAIARLFSSTDESRQILDPLREKREKIYKNLEETFGYKCNRPRDVCELSEEVRRDWSGEKGAQAEAAVSELNALNYQISKVMFDSVPPTAVENFAKLRTALARTFACCRSFRCRTDTFKQNQSINFTRPKSRSEE